MTVSNCFWSLLSLEDMRFLYVPLSVGTIKIPTAGQSIQDLLLNRSLFDFIHPSELELAKSDLSSFLKLQMLAGSVTRCRILSLKSIAAYASKNLPVSNAATKNSMASAFPQPFQPYSIVNNEIDPSKKNNQDNISWDIVDLVIYTATDDTVLAFFHNIDLNFFTTGNLPITRISCSEPGLSSFVGQDAVRLIKALKLLKKQSSTKYQQRKLKGNEFDKTCILNGTNPVRVFQIFDQLKQTLLFTWPPVHPESAPFINLAQSIARDSTLNEFKSSSFKSSSHPVLTGSLSKPSISTAAFYDEQTSLEDIACTRHFYSKTKIEAIEEQACNFQRILIPYGDIAFEAFQVTPIIAAKSTIPLNYWSRTIPEVARKITDSASFQRDHVMKSNNSTQHFESAFLSSQLKTREQQHESHCSTMSSSSSMSLIQTHVGEVEIMASAELEKASYSDGPLRIQNEKQPLLTQQRHYIFTADDYQGGESGSTSRKSWCKNSPINQALFQKFRLQQRNQQDYLQLQQQRQNQKEPHGQNNQHQIHHLGDLESKRQDHSSATITSIEKRRRIAFQNQQNDSITVQESIKICSRCRTSNSPEWRRGPDGHKTLCNACGLRYSRFRSKLWRKNAPSTK